MCTVSRADSTGNPAPHDSPRVWVACLAAYNAGTLHGEWVDLDGLDADELREAIQAVLNDSPEPGAEEWSFFDYDGFHGMNPGENPDLEKLVELAHLLGEHGAAFAAYASVVGEDYATGQGFEDAYRGEWDSERAYAEELFDECYLSDVPESVQPYIDYDKWARDVFIDGCYSAPNPAGGVFVFDHC